ncbi:MAG: hypothetical protein O9346_16525 [Leptospiraceae bacterium]|jgi:hypothetical protein|nr:hypothetical protein [Leptospiraceae bacterium]MCZ8348020.1 hypothetical protein [Leptospiraceae bacterium]PJD99251.1 MAG: hypothetical protein CK427_16200 [Leptospira sp.]
MKVLLDIQDKKAASLLEVLKGLSYVKTKPLTKANAEFLEDAKTAVEEMNQIKQGKLKPRLATDFLNEV